MIVPDTKYDEARRCPTCRELTERTRITDGPTGDKFHHFICKNVRCFDVDTGWIVQVNSDGSIPEYKKGPKQFNKEFLYGAKHALEDLQEDLNRGRLT